MRTATGTLRPLNAKCDAVYLKDPRNPRWVAMPAVAYLWARTARCKGCRATIPLLKTAWLARKGAKRVRLTMTPNAERMGVVFGVEVEVPRGEGNPAERREHDRRTGAGTMSRSGAQCPLCRAITTMQDLRLDGRAGRLDEVMTAVVVDGPRGKEYRLPTELELQAVRVEETELDALYAEIPFGLPDEPTPSAENLGMRVPRYGLDKWRTLFTNRQLLALGTFLQEVRGLPETMADWPEAWREAVVATLTPTLSRLADRGSRLATWTNDPREDPQHLRPLRAADGLGLRGSVSAHGYYGRLHPGRRVDGRGLRAPARSHPPRARAGRATAVSGRCTRRHRPAGTSRHRFHRHAACR